MGESDMDVREILRRVRPDRLLPVLMLLVAFLLVSGTLWSCIHQQRIDPPPPAPGVPQVRVLLTSRPIQAATLSTVGSDGYVLTVDGSVVNTAGALPPTTASWAGGVWTFNARTVRGRRAVLKPLGRTLLRFGKTTYRGELRLLPWDGGGFTVVNHLDLESYLAGVLPKELYGGWSPQTYRALAVTARTFALYHTLNRGGRGDYDLGSDQSAQVYGGFSAETNKSLEAVRYTYGVVLTAGAKGSERIFMTQYSACCGGRVNDAATLRSAPDLAPLQGGQTCNDCQGCSRYRWPTVTISKVDLHRALKISYPAATLMKDVKEIRVRTRTDYGRAIWVDVVGSGGKSIRIRAADIRLSLLRSGLPAARGLYSMNCTIRDRGSAFEFADGRGFGHGVGLCQWGAQGKAVAGRTAEDILDFYYPGAVRLRAY